MKKCARKKCQVKGLQPVENFYKQPSTPDGLMRECKTCRKQQAEEAAEKKRMNNPYAMIIG